MGHHISGIVLPEEMLRNALALFPDIQRVGLSQQFAILPVTAEYLDAVGDTSRVVEPFECLTEQIWNTAQGYSADCGVAFVETEYFGGTGAQCAVAWINCGTVFGPESSETIWNSMKKSYSQTNGWPINEALRAVGVKKEKGADEFDTLGLGNHRSFYELYDT